MLTASPISVAHAARNRRAREAAAALHRDTAPSLAAPARVAAHRDEVRIVVRPATLADWQSWLDRLHVGVRDITLAGSQAIALGRHGGVPVRLVGQGVPALLVSHARDCRKDAV